MLADSSILFLSVAVVQDSSIASVGYEKKHQIDIPLLMGKSSVMKGALNVGFLHSMGIIDATMGGGGGTMVSFHEKGE